MVLSYGSERKNVQAKVRSLLEHSCAALSAFKIVVFFNKTSTEIKTKALNMLLKIIKILNELRIAQLKMNRLYVGFSTKKYGFSTFLT